MPNDVRAPRPVLDGTDRAILAVLAADARTPNNAIAEAVGIAPSTCLARIRTLRERGVIRGFHADIDPAALGRGLQAMIAVRLRAHTRERVKEFIRDVPGLPDVVGVWHVAGADDYLLHIAVADSDALRDFVLEHLTTHPAVGHTETSLIFGHLRGAVGAIAPNGPGDPATSNNPATSNHPATADNPATSSGPTGSPGPSAAEQR